MTYLLDGNVLLALLINGHEHNSAAENWYLEKSRDQLKLATCPTTEGMFIRIHPRYVPRTSIAQGGTILERFQQSPQHEFWLENFSYHEIALHLLQGPKQLTDAWLVELARRKGAKLATFDQPLAKLHPDTVELIPLI